MAKRKPQLTISRLLAEAKLFSVEESLHSEPSLYGVTDGKAIGTYLEHKFQARQLTAFSLPPGNSAKGIDLPELDVDIKVTSIRQPQSSSPFRSARQKIYGLGYSLIVFVYEKKDDEVSKSAILNMQHCVFIDSTRTADFQTTTALHKLLDNGANRDDILACFEERMLPLDEIAAITLADEVLANRPVLGYLTISNALQWRLQYSRVITHAGKIDGLIRV